MESQKDQSTRAENIHDDGSAPVFQVDSFAGIMANTNIEAGLIKFNLCQDLPIMSDVDSGGFGYIQKRVVARLVMTPAVFHEMAVWVNAVSTQLKDDTSAE